MCRAASGLGVALGDGIGDGVRHAGSARPEGRRAAPAAGGRVQRGIRQRRAAAGQLGR
ncbi:hypothetical protein HMPREF0731_2754, partial [Pseudoroseomonas cervicalis ATCC 49957]